MRTLIMSLALLAAACGAPQQAATPAETAESAPAMITTANAWASPTPGGVGVSAGYVSIGNGGDQADRLIGASSPRAGHVELHSMSMNNGVMEMRQIDGADVPAHGAAEFSPGGNHIMFVDITQPFVEGEEIPVTLSFEHSGDVQVSFPVHAGGH